LGFAESFVDHDIPRFLRAASARPLQPTNTGTLRTQVYQITDIHPCRTILVVRALTAYLGLLARGNDGADLLAVDDPGDVALLEPEDHDRQRVVAGQADRGRVGYPQAAGQEVVVRQLVELHRVRV